MSVWLSAFLDLPADRLEAGAGFWQGVTGWERSAPRGRDGEYATLLPAEGDSCLRLQRLGSGAARVHLDLHVESLSEVRAQAVALGATVVDDRLDGDGFVVLRSPGGVVHCLVPAGPSEVPPRAVWDGHAAWLDTVVVDVPAGAYDDERRYWAALCGTGTAGFEGHPEFHRLVARPGALRVLLQRLGSGPARVHLDVASTDRDAEVRRHEDLGAVVVEVFPEWTVMRDPVGLTYCVIDHH